MAHLVIRESPDSGKKGTIVRIGDAPLLFGRGADCSVTISDDALSRRHAELALRGGRFFVRDVGSINGTHVNGARVNERELHHGDVVVIGFTTLHFEDPESVARLDTIVTAPVPVVTAPPPSVVGQSAQAAPPAPPPPLPVPVALPAAPAPPPRPVAPAGAPPAPRGGRRFFACCGCFVLTLVMAGIGGTVWWKFGDRLREFAASRGAASEEPKGEPALIATDFGIPQAKPIEVKRGAELASASVTAKSGGSLATKDGLSITIPPGAFGSDRSVRVFSATVPPPPETVALVGGGDAQLVPLKSWDVDAGPDEGLFDGEVEVNVRCDGGTVPLYAAISVDGKHWTKVPAAIDGGNVTFRTRHFSPVTILGLSQAAAVVLPVVAVTYLIVERAEELPSMYQADAPFVSIDVNPQGFEIYWSKKLKGVDPKSGFRDEAAYKRELEKVAKEYRALGGGGTTGAQSFNTELRELKKKYLMPDAVREIEDALVYAQGYLKTRKIDQPMLSIPIYVVPKLGDASGQVNNPWSGRRYMLIGAESSREVIWTTALHELFHHYQAGYVWIDRTSHLPFVEASALLMEREAKADYEKAGKPFAINEGLALAQMLVYRNGFDGPKEWKEAYVRRHGYGMTWFLEFLRDDRYVGVLKSNDPKTFHAELLKQWRSRWTGAMEKGFKWAAGGDLSLGTAWIDFAQNQVLKGPVDKCGSRSPYGAKYSSCPLSDSPYSGHADDYGLPAGKIDLKSAPARMLGDDDIAKWSIQFYEIVPPDSPKASVIVRTPREWFPKTGKSRAVFLRASAGAEVVPIGKIDAAPPSSPDAYAVLLPAGGSVYAYVVDTGQTGSGWVYANKPAAVFALEPPRDVKSEVDGAKQKLTWTKPPAASQEGLISGYRIYEAGGMTPLGFAKPAETSFDVELAGEAKAIELTSAIEAGKADDGTPVYIESTRSDPVGAANAGSYEMCLDITGDIVAQGDSCDAMLPAWRFDSIQTCIDVTVAPDGSFRFAKQWNGSLDTSNPPRNISIEGEGTFVGSVVKVKGSYTAEAKWGNPFSRNAQSDSGSFAGEGKFIGDVWFGNHLTGTYSSTIVWTYCTKGTQDACEEEKSKTSSCNGTTPAVLSSIDKFQRK